MFNFVSTRTLVLFCQAAFLVVSPQSVLKCGVIPPQGQNFVLSLLSFEKFSLTSSPDYLGPSEGMHDHLAWQPLLQVLCHLQTC